MNYSKKKSNFEHILLIFWEKFCERRIFFGPGQRLEFTDVTLACEDGQQVEAHKVILASYSLFFLNLEEKHSHPMIYMWGIK